MRDSPKMVSYADIVAAKATGAVNKKPIQHARIPTRLTSPTKTISPNTCHQCLFTILKLAPIAGPNFIPRSMIRGSVKVQLTVKYVIGMRQMSKIGSVLLYAFMRSWDMFMNSSIAGWCPGNC